MARTPKTVIVDADDLETLLMVTGVIKNIERAFAGAKTDVQHATYASRYEAAHGRLVKAHTLALREDRITAPPLTDDDQNLLVYWPTESIAGEEPRLQPHLDMRRIETKRMYDNLAAHGMVQFGNALSGVSWAGQPPEWRVDPLSFLIKLTEKGAAERSKIIQAKGESQ